MVAFYAPERSGGSAAPRTCAGLAPAAGRGVSGPSVSEGQPAAPRHARSVSLDAARRIDLTVLLADGRSRPAVFLRADPLPAPRGRRVRIFPHQRVGHGHAPVSLGESSVILIASEYSFLLQ
jgi:hypothetical protein